MTKTAKAILLTTIFLVPLAVMAAGDNQKTFSPYVDGAGAITLPADFRATWAHLGTWALTSQAAVGPNVMKTSHGTGLHDVYTRPESLEAFKKTGAWPDGAVLVMEARPIQWDDLSTGHVMYAGDTPDWFVMVRDVKGRFKDHPGWGDGWGWALFRAADPGKNASASYKNDCLGCHETAKDSGYVFVHGYPALR